MAVNNMIVCCLGWIILTLLLFKLICKIQIIMVNTFFFFASFGRLDQLPAGGGQTAARRLWKTLEKHGFNVELYNRHRFYWMKHPFDKITILLFEIIDPIWMFFVLLHKKHKDTAFLFMSYAGGLVYFDMLMTLAVSLTGHKKIMYLAGGMAQNYYHQKGNFYRWIFRKTMMMYDIVMCEGEVNVQLVDEITNGKTKTFYLPNFTEDGFAPDSLPNKPEECINIFYFGRIDKTKQVLLGVEIFNRLCEKYDNLRYTIVGGGNEDYDAKVISAINSSPYKSRIKKIGRSSHKVLAEMMRIQHIYLFPSNEPCEGHSNALNEAMAWGLVPIVSNNNFLPSIVGDDSLVAKDNEAITYVRIISNLIDNNLILEKSKQMYYRVKNNFTQSVVEERLINELKTI